MGFRYTKAQKRQIKELLDGYLKDNPSAKHIHLADFLNSRNYKTAGGNPFTPKDVSNFTCRVMKKFKFRKTKKIDKPAPVVSGLPDTFEDIDLATMVLSSQLPLASKRLLLRNLFQAGKYL